MIKQELIDELKNKFYKVDEANIREGKTEAGITAWSVGVFDKVGDAIRKRNLTFYTEGDEAYWGGSEPKVTPPTPDTFRSRVQGFIDAKVDDGTIQFGFIEETQDGCKKALVKAIKAGVEKKAIVTEDSVGDFSILIL